MVCSKDPDLVWQKIIGQQQKTTISKYSLKLIRLKTFAYLILIVYYIFFYCIILHY